MKTLSSEALDAIASNRVIMAGAARFAFGDEYRLWSGVGTLTLPDVGDFIGIGARALIVPIHASSGEGVDGVRLSLSRLDPTIAATINDETYQQKPVTIWRCFFDSETHAFLDAETYFRGRVNTVLVRETARAEAAIEITVEGAGVDMNRRGARVRSNTDQRVLGGATDGGFKHIAIAAERTLYWGQRPARPFAGGGGDGRPVYPGHAGSEHFQFVN